MQFLALRSDGPLPTQYQDKFVQMQVIECFKRKRVRYHLYAPILQAERDQIEAHGMWLSADLPKLCPDHPYWFLTPDKPGE
jgi:hypothetical protein